MEKLVYKDGDIKGWLKEKDLVIGRVYLIKDGRLMLYLGKSTTGMYIFYVMASAYLEYTRDDGVTFGNYNIQVKGLVNIINESMNNVGVIGCLLQYKGLPKIHGEFPLVNFEHKYNRWYTISFTQMFSNKVPNNLPKLASMTNKPIETGYVKAKDLVQGNIYYSGACWRSTYVYLGRKTSGEYIWYFVGNEKMLIGTPARDLLNHSEVTKQNKKVKPLRMALSDEHASLCAGARELIEMNYRVDMSGITQHMLDSVY